MVFITGAGHGRPQPPKAADSRTNSRGHVGAEHVLKLGRPDGGRVSVVTLIHHGAFVAVTNPDGLAIGEAGGGREAHRVGSFVSLV